MMNHTRPIRVFGFHICLGLHQHLHALMVISTLHIRIEDCHQRGLPQCISGMHIYAVVQQHAHAPGMTSGCHEMKGPPV
jgi:hypothetical protein